MCSSDLLNMSKGVPPISKYMTPMPHSIEPHESLEVAKKRMDENNFRHLPVLSGGKVAGLLSERDVSLLATFKGVDMRHSKVSDAMMFDPFCADPSDLVDDVCAHMAENKIGSALIVQKSNGKLVGIFTYIDALRCLAELFETRLKK